MRRLRRRRRDDELGGQDSFLDIVANLVGILVILVMVIGVRAQDALVQSNVSGQNDAERSGEDALHSRIRAAEATAVDLTANLHEIENESHLLQQATQQQQALRQRLNVLLTRARYELKQEQESLDQEQREQLETAAELDGLSAQLSQLQMQQQTLQQQEQPVVELEHLPTPLAKTVFGGEEHFQLKNERLAYVPLNELTDRLRQEAPKKIFKLKQLPQVTELIGPVEGFHMRYTLHRRSVPHMTKFGPMVREMAELKQFVLVPTSPVMGETLPTALAEGSDFRRRLDTFSPETVLTIWTYPDSFGQYRPLKKWLFQRGYASAARPLPADQPISGSPSGSRSAAQ